MLWSLAVFSSRSSAGSRRSSPGGCRRSARFLLRLHPLLDAPLRLLLPRREPVPGLHRRARPATRSTSAAGAGAPVAPADPLPARARDPRADRRRRPSRGGGDFRALGSINGPRTASVRYGGLSACIAFLGWFACLVTGGCRGVPRRRRLRDRLPRPGPRLRAARDRAVPELGSARAPRRASRLPRCTRSPRRRRRRPPPFARDRPLPTAAGVPHLVWLALWTIPALLVAILSGSSPSFAGTPAAAAPPLPRALRPLHVPRLRVPLSPRTRSRASPAARAVSARPRAARPGRQNRWKTLFRLLARGSRLRRRRALARPARRGAPHLVRGARERARTGGPAQPLRLRAPLQRPS